MRSALLLAALLLAPLATAQTTFTVTLETKTAEHPYVGQGHPSGYVIDGVQGATVELVAGQAYTFQLSGISSVHPFYISTDEAGAGAGVFQDGVEGNFSSGDAAVTFTPPLSAAGTTLWYQCGNHQFMGYQLSIVPPLSTEEDGAARRLALRSGNPGVGGARVTLELAETESVRVEAFDLRGRHVATLWTGALAGATEHAFELADLAPGAYVVRATGADWAESLRVTVAR